MTPTYISTGELIATLADRRLTGADVAAIRALIERPTDITPADLDALLDQTPGQVAQIVVSRRQYERLIDTRHGALRFVSVGPVTKSFRQVAFRDTVVLYDADLDNDTLNLVMAHPLP